MKSIRYAVRHETLYSYRGEVAHSHQQLHLTPRNSERQRASGHCIRIAPQPALRVEFVDAFGNRVTRFELDRPHARLEVIAEMDVTVTPRPQLELTAGESWEKVRDRLCYNAHPRAEPWLTAVRFRTESPFVRIKGVFGEFARDCLTPGASVLTVAEALMGKIHREFTYAPGTTEVATPLLEVMAARRGVCQDFAHLMIACLRSAGLAARYVSGYLCTAAAGAAELLGSDASHAWVAVFAPPFGWVEVDPTNHMHVHGKHIALAYGRDFGDVSPLRGVILGGDSHELTVRVAVRHLP